MLPKVYLALMNDPAVTALIGNRAYRHGSAPQGVTYPYVTWGVPAGDATIVFDQTDADQFRVQVDCWSSQDADKNGIAGVETVAAAVRAALEPYAHLVAYTNDERDPDTQAFRLGFAFDWWYPRDL